MTCKKKIKYKKKMIKINNYNPKNEIWSEDIIKRETKWIISKENMKWKNQINNNYVWLYRVFLTKRSNISSDELNKKESVYFRNLLIMHKKVILDLAVKAKLDDENKVRTTKMLEIIPYFRGFRRGKFLNDNTNVFSNMLVTNEKEDLREYYKNLLGENIRNHSLYNLLNVNNKLKVGYKIKQMGIEQIIDEKYSNQISRKMENRLTIPHYFFSNRYISRSNILSQVRNWPNTIYSYIKPTIVNIKYTDLITTEFLKVFFNPKLLKRKVIKGSFSEWKVLASMSIVPLKLLNKFMNELIKFTSQRSQYDSKIRNVIRYNNNILSFSWVKRELSWAKILRKIFKSRREKFDRGFTPKRAVLFNIKRNIWLSKPLFKHTASNVIIDLYLFNNKSYKLNKYHHMIKVRTIYKYMYSMYANYDEIIQNILSRPRIFYINIIDPKMHEYYSRVIKSYENALVHFSKSHFMYFLLDLLKWNLTHKLFAYILPSQSGTEFNSKDDNNKSNTCLSLVNNKDYNYIYDNSNYENNDKINKLSDFSSSSFGLWVTENSNYRTQKYIPLKWNKTSNDVNEYIYRSLGLRSKISKYRSIYNNEKKNIFINDYITLINNDVYKIEKKNKRNLSWWKNEYYLLKELGPRYNAKAMAKLSDIELEKNAITPLKYEDYPRWSKELILKRKEEKKYKDRRVRIFGIDKYSIKKYKRHIKKGKKLSTLTPDFLNAEMAKYNTFSKAQKANLDPNNKWVYDSKTKIKVHILAYKKDPSIFEKIKRKNKYNKKLKKLRFFNVINKVKTNNVNTINQLSIYKKNNIVNTKSNLIETNGNNLSTINTKAVDSNISNISNIKGKFSQDFNQVKLGLIEQSNSNNYSGKPYHKNKGIDNNQNQSKSGIYNKFGIELNKLENKNKVKYSDYVNYKYKNQTNVNIEANKNKGWLDSKNKDSKDQIKNSNNIGSRKSQFVKKENNSIFPSWNINDEINTHLKNAAASRLENENRSPNKSGGKGKETKWWLSGNKRKLHTLRFVSKVKNKNTKPINNINNRIKIEKLITKNSKSLNILLRLLREGRINKRWLMNKINKLNIIETNNNILNINKNLLVPTLGNGNDQRRILKLTKMVKETLALRGNVSTVLSNGDIKNKKDDYINIWNLLNENWNLSKYDNIYQSKGKDIKNIIREKKNYIKYVKDNYKNDMAAKYKKLSIKANIKNISNNNKNDLNLKSIIDLKSKINWDNLDKSLIRMILILMLNSNKRVYKNNIRTYLKWRRKDIGRGRHLSKKWMKNELILDQTTEGTISKRIRKLNEKINVDYKKYLHYSYEKLIGAIRNKFINNDKLYLDTIKQEFNKINRDVIKSKITDNYTYDSNTIMDSYVLGYNIDSINAKLWVGLDKLSKLSVRLWQTLNFDKREDNLLLMLRFSDNAIKPYYRFMIRLLIFEEYKKFVNRLGFKDISLPIDFTNYYGTEGKFSWFKDNGLKIINFIAVKTLFNVFKYNYRSLYILKPKFYHINKLRLFKKKAKRLNFNTWLRSIRYIKTLRKAPKNYWLRYHKLVNIYYQRILSFAKWDTERKVLMPYVLYFEDLLYNIYGKLALVRIWPLKKYFLSIYILTERLMLLLDKSAHRKKRRKNLKFIFTGFVLNFLNLINKTKIEKIYEANLGSNSRWPTDLITQVNKDLPLASNYNKLEYFSRKLNIPYQLNSYVMKYGQLDDFMDIPNFNYWELANDQYSKIKDSRINMRKSDLYTRSKKGLMKYWTRPIKNMLIDMNLTQDIRGYLFKLAGRAKGIPRKFSIWHQWGSFSGAKHYNKLTYKYITLSSMHIRNTIRPTMDYNDKSATFPAGTSNLKVWYSSLLSSDVMELIFYLLKKKVVYNALMNRNFFVHKNLKYILQYKKWTPEKTKPLFSDLKYLKFKLLRRINKKNKRFNKYRHLNFGITVKNRFIRNLNSNNIKINNILQNKSPFRLRK
jgi:hypothetical protein